MPVTFGDINELFELRTILEAAAAQLACLRITDAELEQLTTLADVIYDRAEQPTLKRFIDATGIFIWPSARPQATSASINRSRGRSANLSGFFIWAPACGTVSRETRDDHHRIVDVLRMRDPDAGRRIMIDHNDATRRGLVQQIASSKGMRQVEL